MTRRGIVAESHSKLQALGLIGIIAGIVFIYAMFMFLAHGFGLIYLIVAIPSVACSVFFIARLIRGSYRLFRIHYGSFAVKKPIRRKDRNKQKS